MTERYCANPDHIRASGRDAPSLTFSDEDCFYRDSDEPGSECVPAVLLPVTQRQAEQRVIECVPTPERLRLLANWIDKIDRERLAGKLNVTPAEIPDFLLAGAEVQRELRALAAALPAVQGIPGTHTVDVNVPPITTDVQRLCEACPDDEPSLAVTADGLCELCATVRKRIAGIPVDTEAGNG